VPAGPWDASPADGRGARAGGEVFVFLMREAWDRVVGVSAAALALGLAALARVYWERGGRRRLRRYWGIGEDAVFACRYRGGDTGKAERDLPGACACGAVRFVVAASPHVEAFERPGKVRYPHLVTRTSGLSVQADSEAYLERFASTAGVWLFCRKCGCHVARVHEDWAMVNVDLLDPHYVQSLIVRSYSNTALPPVCFSGVEAMNYPPHLSGRHRRPRVGSESDGLEEGPATAATHRLGATPGELAVKFYGAYASLDKGADPGRFEADSGSGTPPRAKPPGAKLSPESNHPTLEKLRHLTKHSTMSTTVSQALPGANSAPNAQHHLHGAM